MFDGLIELLEKMFVEKWTAAIVGAVGVLLFFAICLTLGLSVGDFAKNRRAAKLLAGGDVENGLKGLKGFAPAYDKSREISPPESAFDYDKIIGFPYSYSMIKKLPGMTLAGTAFFTVFAAAASLIQAGKLTHSTSFMLIFVPLTGLILYIISLVVAGKMLKSAGKRYYAMIEHIKDVNVRPAGEVISEEEYVPQSVVEICNRIQEIAVCGGANHEILSMLYTEIILEQKKYQGGEAGERLAAALDVLSALIDSAL